MYSFFFEFFKSPLFELSGLFSLFILSLSSSKVFSGIEYFSFNLSSNKL